MNTLSDLRSTLGEHAERVPDGEAVVRTAGIRHRISVVRRRRRAVGAGTLALAVAVVVAVVGVNRASSNQPPVVFGVHAPETITSLGYTYRSDGSAKTLDGRASLEFGASTQSRLVSWTTDRPTTIRLKLPDGEYLTSSVSRFHDYAVIAPGPGGTLQVTVPEGRVGLAMYDVTGAQPDGVTRDGITFRRTVADTPLLGAAIGAAGQTEVSTSFTGVPGQVRISVLCSGVPSGSTVHVDMGRGIQSSGGCDGNAFDPGADSVGSTGVGHVGQKVSVRVWVSGPDSTTPLASDSDNVRVGVGLYGPVVSQQVAGVAMNQTIEYAGHTWDLGKGMQVHTSPLRYTAGREPFLAAPAIRLREARTLLVFSATGMPTQRTAVSGQGSGSVGPYWVPADAQVRVTRSTPGALGLGVYERGD